LSRYDEDDGDTGDGADDEEKEGVRWFRAGDEHANAESDMAETRQTAALLHQRLEQANFDVQEYAASVEQRHKCIAIDGMNLKDLPVALQQCCSTQVS
jgi:hypothetical protein